jgi:hypothetical protein
MIYADFVNGNYWGNGAVTDAATLFVANADWGNWNPAAIQAGQGMGANGASGGGEPTIARTFLTSVFAAGGTVVAVTNCPASADLAYTFELDFWDDPAFSSDYFGGFNQAGANFSGPAYSRIGISNPLGSTPDLGNVTPISVGTGMAFTIPASGADMAYSFNGGASVMLASEAPPVAWTDIGIYSYYDTLGAPGYLATLAIYAPQPNVDLPTLSTP